MAPTACHVGHPAEALVRQDILVFRRRLHKLVESGRMFPAHEHRDGDDRPNGLGRVGVCPSEADRRQARGIPTVRRRGASARRGFLMNWPGRLETASACATAV